MRDAGGYLAGSKWSDGGRTFGMCRTPEAKYEGEIQAKLAELLYQSILKKHQKIHKKGVLAACPDVILLLWEFKTPSFLASQRQPWIAHSEKMPVRLRLSPHGFIVDSRRNGGCLASLPFHHSGQISLSDTEISNAGLEHLHDVVAGRFVDLSRTRITDVSSLFGNRRSDHPLGLKLSGNRIAPGAFNFPQPKLGCPMQELDSDQGSPVGLHTIENNGLEFA